MNQEQSAKYNFSIILLVILLTGLVVGSGVYLWQKSYNKKLQAQNQQLQQEINELQDKVNELQNQIAQLQGQQGTQENGEEPIDKLGTTEKAIGKPITLSVLIDVKSFDLDSKTFKGRTHPEGKNVKILTTDSTKFYRTAEPDWQKEYFTFSEFYSLLKNWSGPFYPFTVKGILGERNIIRANEVFMIVQ